MSRAVCSSQSSYSLHLYLRDNIEMTTNSLIKDAFEQICSNESITVEMFVQYSFLSHLFYFAHEIRVSFELKLIGCRSIFLLGIN